MATAILAPIAKAPAIAPSGPRTIVPIIIPAIKIAKKAAPNIPLSKPGNYSIAGIFFRRSATAWSILLYYSSVRDL